jgi:hypothetical protein
MSVQFNRPAAACAVPSAGDPAFARVSLVNSCDQYRSNHLSLKLRHPLHGLNVAVPLEDFHPRLPVGRRSYFSDTGAVKLGKLPAIVAWAGRQLPGTTHDTVISVSSVINPCRF